MTNQNSSSSTAVDIPDSTAALSRRNSSICSMLCIAGGIGANADGGGELPASGAAAADAGGGLPASGAAAAGGGGGLPASGAAAAGAGGGLPASGAAAADGGGGLPASGAAAAGAGGGLPASGAAAAGGGGGLPASGAAAAGAGGGLPASGAAASDGGGGLPASGAAAADGGGGLPASGAAAADGDGGLQTSTEAEGSIWTKPVFSIFNGLKYMVTPVLGLAALKYQGNKVNLFDVNPIPTWCLLIATWAFFFIVGVLKANFPHRSGIWLHILVLAGLVSGLVSIMSSIAIFIPRRYSFLPLVPVVAVAAVLAWPMLRSSYDWTVGLVNTIFDNIGTCVAYWWGTQGSSLPV